MLVSDKALLSAEGTSADHAVLEVKVFRDSHAVGPWVSLEDFEQKALEGSKTKITPCPFKSILFFSSQMTSQQE